MRELLYACVKEIPQSSEVDAVFLNDTGSLGLTVKLQLAICSEMPWVSAQDCPAELLFLAFPSLPVSQYTQLSAVVPL